MKNSLYIIAALLIVIWSILYFSFQTGSIVYSLLILAGGLILNRMIFNNPLTGR